MLRLPGTMVRVLDSMNTLAERLEHVMEVMERLEGGVSIAGSGLDLAALGISQAVTGLDRAVGALDGSLPNLSASASALRMLTERLGGVAAQLATELPRATDTLQTISPELAKIVGTFDERFGHLDGVVTDLAKLVESVIGTIPGMRRVLRTTSGV
jgi:ABC-type transporter Mla subunit MlaD